MSARSPTPAAAGRPGRAGLRSLTAKVALLFTGVILVAFGVVYFYVVPQLESNLEEQVLTDLGERAEGTAGGIEGVMGTDTACRQVDMVVRRAAADADARIDVLGIQRSADGSGAYYTISESSSGDSGSDCRNLEIESERDANGATGRDAGAVPEVPETEPERPNVSLTVADAAAEEGELGSGIGRDDGELVAQAAVPLGGRAAESGPEWIAVYSRPLVRVTEAVGLIQRQVLVAGLLALLVALAGGFVVARAVARRVRRLEVAARRVAAGRSFAPLPIDSEDELGQLTRTFNEMQEQLARTERARRDFVANASHELRTPIFSLGGFAELLQDEELDEATRESFLASMREQIDRLQRLSADLLDLSRLDAGALIIHPRQVDLSEVAGTVASEFIPAAAAKGAALEIDLPDGELEAWCDPDRVAQIVRILLDNALRHNPEGTRIVLSALRRGSAVEVTVSDSGPELGPPVAERVFERFYTADAASGSGLGLAIAQELARRMYGRLELMSRREHKAFTLVLPVTPDGDPRPPTGESARRSTAADRPKDAALATATTPGDRRAAE